MSNKSLVVFVKNPLKGQVKTRLAKDIGDEKALKVYEYLLDRCRLVCEEVVASRYLYYHKNIPIKDKWADSLFQKRLQVEGDLGLKMSSAIEDCFSASSQDSVVLIGSDCYDLDAQIINKAFDALKFSDLVIGPANDGGYYLIGMKKLYKGLFSNIPWSTDQVLSQTLSKANDKKLTYLLLEELIDLDTFDDLKLSGFPDDII
jgi:rSAM/selenodomain-associated transferase 1